MDDCEGMSRSGHWTLMAFLPWTIIIIDTRRDSDSLMSFLTLWDGFLVCVCEGALGFEQRSRICWYGHDGMECEDVLRSSPTKV